MQAVILVGGEGTRLRPLTSSTPKPAIRLVDRPFIYYMLDWLSAHGVREAILACGFRTDRLRKTLGNQPRRDIKLRFVEEPEPLGTGGALKFAAQYLEDRFLMFNGDVLTDIDLSAQIAQHKETGAVGTLALVPVEDPTAYGLVRIDQQTHAVSEFLEKPDPRQIDTNLISAGAYILEQSVLNLIADGRAVSIEREVWPALVGNGLYGYPSDSYWVDIGTPHSYLQATEDILSGTIDLVNQPVSQPSPANAHIGIGCLLEQDIEIGNEARIDRHSVIGYGTRIGEGTLISRSVIFEGAHIGDHCSIVDCVVGSHAKIADGVELHEQTLIGAGSSIAEGNLLARGIRINEDTKIPPNAIWFR